MPALKTQVVILTGKFRIEGEINLIPGARLTDFMNEVNNKFMVVTDALVTDYGGKEIMRGTFIDVLVSNIEIILPAENAS
jgi:hypothetical protein